MPGGLAIGADQQSRASNPPRQVLYGNSLVAMRAFIQEYVLTFQLRWTYTI